MGQILGQDNLPAITVASTTSVSLAATNNGQTTTVTIGGQQWSLTTALTLLTGSTGANGLDTGSLSANQLWYVYAITNSSTFAVALIASLTASSTGPTIPVGYFAAYKQIGTFSTNASSQIITANTTPNYILNVSHSPGTVSTGGSPVAYNFDDTTETQLSYGITHSYSSGRFTWTFPQVGQYSITSTATFNAGNIGQYEVGVSEAFNTAGTATSIGLSAASPVWCSNDISTTPQDYAGGTLVFAVGVTAANQTFTLKPRSVIGVNGTPTAYMTFVIQKIA